MENQPPTVLRGGGEPARKVGLAGPMTSQVPLTPGLSSRTPFGMGTPAAASKTGGNRMALGDISNMKKRAATASQHGGAKSSNPEAAAVVACAAADLHFAEVDLPPTETAYPCEPMGPVTMDDSDLDVNAAVAALCQYRALTLGGTPYERRTHAHHLLEQPPVLAEVPPSPAAGLAKRAAARAPPPAVFDNVEDEEDELETNVTPAQPQLDGDGEDGDDLDDLEMQIDLSRLELVPSTPLAPEEAEDEDAGEGCDLPHDGDEDASMVSEVEGAAPLDLSGRLALLSMDMEAQSTDQTSA